MTFQVRLARWMTVLALLVTLFTGTALAGDERAPFTAARFVGDDVEIEVDATWYRLRSLDGIAASKILAHCKQTYGDKWQKRFTEDLVEVLAGLDHRCGPTVALEVEKLDGGDVVKLPNVAMTEEKRREARNARRGRKRPEPRGFKKDDDDYAKLAPYTGVRFVDEGTDVQVKGKWYRLVAIDGVKAADLVAFAKQRHGRRWAKRIGEDLVQVMTEMGHPPGKDVALSLKDLESGEAVEMPQVPMTSENRRSVWVGNQRGERAASGPVRRVQREHSGRVTPAYEVLAQHVEGNALGKDRTLTRAQAEQDLDELEWHVNHRFAYRDLRGLDVPAMFDTIRASLPEKIPRNAFAIRIVKLLALFGDAHSRIDESPMRLYAAGYAPFLVMDASPRLVAVQPDRSDFLDPEFPYLTHVDGEPVEKWLVAAERISPHGTPQLLRAQSIRNLRYVQQLRREMGLAERERLTVQVEDEKGQHTRELEVGLAPRPPVYGTWPRTESRLLDGDLGYLRIETMSTWRADELERGIDRVMDGFRRTRGLIIDVRGNGGGRRAILQRLFPYFLTAEDGARVVNVARYRLQEGDDAQRPAGFLEDRSLFPAAYGGWTDVQREAVRRTVKTFDPQWTPRDGQFSAWHYMVVEHGSNPRAYHYGKPVVVLIDTRCYSATDVFVGAFAGRRNVTLMGLPTGGGSGRSQPLRLAHSRLGVRLSSMASFRPDGKIYEFEGSAPDVRVAPRATDFIGRTDTLLDAAVRHLLEAK